MYINKIHIQNYRNYNDFTMDFHKGLNVIIGSNNSGKTGLLYAINLLNSPSSISVDDFNKNNLLKYDELYAENAPEIVIEYYISHRIAEDDTNDESIIRLLPFLGIKEFEENRTEKDGKVEYNIAAKIKAVFSLDVKYLDDYKKELKSVNNFDEYFMLLKRFVEKHYSWSYTNGITETKAEQKAVTSVFDIRLIEAERTSEEVRKETKREIETVTKESDRAVELDALKKSVSDDLKKILNDSITKLSDLFENEDNEIGLKKGNVSIFSDVKAKFSVSDAYVTEVKDTKSGFVVPLQHNGLGYNNLINIYMLADEENGIDGERAKEIITDLKEMFEYLIIDCEPEVNNPLSVYSLVYADKIINLIKPTITGVAFFNAYRPLFSALDIADNKILYVSNNDKNYVGIRSIERSCGIKTVLNIPYFKNVEQAENKGRLACFSKNGFYYDMEKLADCLTESDMNG